VSLSGWWLTCLLARKDELGYGKDKNSTYSQKHPLTTPVIRKDAVNTVIILKLTLHTYALKMWSGLNQPVGGTCEVWCSRELWRHARWIHCDRECKFIFSHVRATCSAHYFTNKHLVDRTVVPYSQLARTMADAVRVNVWFVGVVAQYLTFATISEDVPNVFMLLFVLHVVNMKRTYF